MWWGIARSGRERRTGSRGVASLEFVLVLPLLLAMLALVVDLGRLLADYHAVSKSARDAARYLARVEGGAGGLAIDCAAGTLEPTSVEAGNALRLTLTGRIDGDPATQALVAGWRALSPGEAGASVTIAVECENNAGGALQGLYDGADRVPSVVVTATVPFRFSLARLVGLGPALDFTVRRRMAYVGV